MGANPATVRKKARQKRHKREVERLAAKAEQGTKTDKKDQPKS